MYLPTRKKIRGWKRKIRKLDAWGERILSPHVSGFIKYGYTYERCTMCPFYMLEKRHPPVWFFKLIMKKMIVAYHQWEEEFKRLGEPFDVALWIYDPRFIWSEIVCYKVIRRAIVVSLLECPS